MRKAILLLSNLALAGAWGPGIDPIEAGLFTVGSPNDACLGYVDPCGVKGSAAAWSSNMSSWPNWTIRASFFVLASDDGGDSSTDPMTIAAQVDVLNRYFSGMKVSFEHSYQTINSSFYLQRRVMPLCDFAGIGNGVCDPLCNATATAYDGGDCIQLPAKTPQCNSTNQCIDACNFAVFEWSNGACCDDSVSNPALDCKDPNSPLRSYVSTDEIKLAAHPVPPSESWNIYIAPYTVCQFCGASTTFPWMFNGSNVLSQGSVFNNYTLPTYNYLIAGHEFGHTLGLLHPFTYSESGSPPCDYPCFDGTQYPMSDTGSEMTGDLISDTRPTVMALNTCQDPPGVDCSGQPWTDSPRRNLMGFGYLVDDCVSTSTAFTPMQKGRMRCFLEVTYSEWAVDVR